ncbi:MAG: hypothetical protein JJT96_13065 [Opitutales bacterium]|nr:hypothetical protein [Opitutales bacterium]
MKASSFISLAIIGVLPLSLPAALTTIFAPDFLGSYQGVEDNQFNFIGSAEGGAYASFSVVDGWFRMVTNHQVDSLINQSATRLSRHGGSTSANALPFEDNFALISLAYRFAPIAWTGTDRSILNVVVGQNFRSGAFNPARGGAQADGPAFANLNVQARATEGLFRVIAGGGPGSSNFSITAGGDGAYALNLTVALNNGPSARTFNSPTGSHTLEAGRVSVWANGELVWDNYDHTNLNKSAQFHHVSFGFGNGTFADFTTAQALGGTYELRDIVVRTGEDDLPPPSGFAAWAAGAGWTGADAAPGADPRKDGRTNLFVYSQGGEPLAANAVDFPLLESVGGELRLAFRRMADATLIYEVWASADLSDWGDTPVWSSTGADNVEGPVTVVVPAAPGDGTARFLRLGVRLP